MGEVLRAGGEARRALVGLLTTAPTTLPSDVVQKVEADNVERARSIARIRARRAAFCWLPFLPFALILGVRSHASFVVAACSLVAATAIGQELGLMGAAEASALVAAGLLSVLIFPITGLNMLKRAMSEEGTAPPDPGQPDAAPQMAM